MKPTEALRPWIPERPPPNVPARPKVTSEWPEQPPVAEDLSERITELRALIPDELPKVAPHEPFVVDRENPKVVPKFVFEAVRASLATGKKGT